MSPEELCLELRKKMIEAGVPDDLSVRISYHVEYLSMDFKCGRWEDSLYLVKNRCSYTVNGDQPWTISDFYRGPIQWRQRKDGSFNIKSMVAKLVSGYNYITTWYKLSDEEKERKKVLHDQIKIVGNTLELDLSHNLGDVRIHTNGGKIELTFASVDAQQLLELLTRGIELGVVRNGNRLQRIV